MALDIVTLLDKIKSHAQSTGYFQRVNGHEPKNAPGNGLFCAVWLGDIEPVRASGLAEVSIVVNFTIRVYLNFVQKPEDSIDPHLAQAVDGLMTAYAGDFDLGGNARNIDVFGSTGNRLVARPGYLDQDGKKFRVFVINVPVIVNDVWAEAA